MVPLVRPVTTIGLPAPVPVRDTPEAVQVTVYAVIVELPLELGAVKATVALAFPAVALTAEGAPGAVTGEAVAGATLLEHPASRPSQRSEISVVQPTELPGHRARSTAAAPSG